MAHNGNQFTQGQEPTAAAPTPSPALDDEMLEGSGSDSDSSDDENNDTNQAEVRDLKRRLRMQEKQHSDQAKQMAAMQEMMAQMVSQLMATPNEKPPPKPKMAVPEKYEGGRNELRTFLTNIDLYCGFN